MNKKENMVEKGSEAYFQRQVAMGRSALLLVVAYLVNCFWISWLLHRFCGMAQREAMLAATPAGASDMALISGDMGISNPDLNVLQIIRMVTVVLVFPQIIYFIVSLL